MIDPAGASDIYRVSRVMPHNFPSSPFHSGTTPGGELVYVIDDDASFRKSLARLLRSAGLKAVPLDAADVFLETEPHPGPCCVILDVQMPGLDGLELQQSLVGRGEQIIFLTGYGDVPMCAEAMKAGAVDFLTKPVDDEKLLDAVWRALRASNETRQVSLARSKARARIEVLTPREFEVLQHVIAGSLNKQIADKLGAAEKTIKIHRGRVMEKMGVQSVAKLVRLAQEAGVSPSPS